MAETIAFATRSGGKIGLAGLIRRPVKLAECWKSGVSIAGGYTVVTEMPWWRVSSRTDSVNARTACLLAAYAETYGPDIRPSAEEMLTRTPFDRARCGSAARVPCTTPNKFTLMTRRNAFSGVSWTFPIGETPALFTQASIRP